MESKSRYTIKFEVLADKDGWEGYIVRKDGEVIWYMIPDNFDGKETIRIYAYGDSVDTRPAIEFHHVVNGFCYIEQVQNRSNQ